MPTKRLYRVTADYGDHERVKHFQSKRAAMNHAAHLLSGKSRYDEWYDRTGSNPLALSAIIEESNPITFPQES